MGQAGLPVVQLAGLQVGSTMLPGVSLGSAVGTATLHIKPVTKIPASSISASVWYRTIQGERHMSLGVNILVPAPGSH